MKNWLNDTARALNGKIYQRRQKGPGIATRAKWHREFLDLGLDHKMSFASYLKGKTKIWHSQKYQKKKAKMVDTQGH